PKPTAILNQPKSTTTRKKTLRKKSANGKQVDLFSQPQSSASNLITSKSNEVEIKTIQEDLIKFISEPAPFKGKLQPFHRNDTLVVEHGLVGYLQNVDIDQGTAIFHPLKLSLQQLERTKAYIQIRDTYNDLYTKEASLQSEQKEERKTLNGLYDAFVKIYGNLNSAYNIKLIKTDSAGRDIPYLERVVGGVVHKADIFHHPVSFSTVKITTDNPDEALAASLNKYGKVDLNYMSEVSGIEPNELIEALKTKLY